MTTQKTPTLSQAQKSIVTKARKLGSGPATVKLDDAVCSYLVGTIANDLEIREQFPEFEGDLPTFYSSGNLSDLRVDEIDFPTVAAKLFVADRDADTYFACLANIHKRRLKYQNILRSQPIPTIEQVGPRGLLQYGSLKPKSLVALLFWRKWIYDIDNRAAQETAYLFEPIIASAIGGAPASAGKSPVKRENDANKGRQVDCIVEDRAYEFKLRVTIAASGQGRWGEELQYPRDCRLSGHTPVLVVLDSTPNSKLTELSAAFEAEDGEVYVGNDAWAHLEEAAGTTMFRFLQLYVREPIESLLAEEEDDFGDLHLSHTLDRITIVIDGEQLTIDREPGEVDDADEMPEDVDEQLPGL